MRMSDWSSDVCSSDLWINPAGEDDTALLAELAGPTITAFLDQVGDLLSAEARNTLNELPSLFAPWLKARAERFALVHGDYRLDNLMFSTADEEDRKSTRLNSSH